MSQRPTPRRSVPQPRTEPGRGNPSSSRPNRKGRNSQWRVKEEEPDEFMVHSSGSEELSPEEEEEEAEEEASNSPMTSPSGRLKPPPKAKKAPARSETAALTGHLAPFSTLSCRRSHDPVLSAAWELHGRLVTFKWKQFLWMLRVYEGMWQEGRRWRRNPRWLALMFARETASIYGHLGASVKYLQGLQSPALFK